MNTGCVGITTNAGNLTFNSYTTVSNDTAIQFLGPYNNGGIFQQGKWGYINTGGFNITDGSSLSPPLVATFNSLGVNINSLVTGPVYSNGGRLSNTGPSDASLKRNVIPLVASVDLLNPVQYYWIDCKTHGSCLNFGFLANEIQVLFPNLVSTWKDADGNDKLGYDPVSLIPVLTSAIKQQNVVIRELQSQLTDVLRRLNAAGIP